MGEKRNTHKFTILELEGIHFVGELGIVWRIIFNFVLENKV
jgi:hypothetical protein